MFAQSKLLKGVGFGLEPEVATPDPKQVLTPSSVL
jgi:hypothetical protein